MINRMMGVNAHVSDHADYVEVDPTGRYGRYNEILGKGASKTVYRAFDEYEGIEVAWNQVKLYDFLQSSEDLERLYCEIHLLKTLKHKNIMKFYTSWVDIPNRNINFVTEMFTSGTLRQYRQKHKSVNIRAVKNWCRQILMGLLYLHSHHPPVIHRDLKCDNIFINGNQGEVKIGDLGLAAILRKSLAAHCVGTPEFMAPEIYDEEYNELVDIYSFGMCVLEMVTFEYPYSECTHPAQIYKKVISGTKPKALYRLKDDEVRQFVEKCLATASQRLSARELLKDPFLQNDDLGSGSWEGETIGMRPVLWQPSYNPLYRSGSLTTNGLYENLHYETNMDEGWSYNSANYGLHGIDLFNSHEDEPLLNVDITIKGRRREDGDIFLKLRVGDKEGRVRNIYFPFDIETDTALGVAAEMVAELDITDHEVIRIAEMIDGEVSSLEPKWKRGLDIEDTPSFPAATSSCHNCTSNVSSRGSHLNYLSRSNSCCATHCSSHIECGAMHGRFEEILCEIEGSEESSGLDGISYASSESIVDEESGRMDHLDNDKTVTIRMDFASRSSAIESQGQEQCFDTRSEDYENEIRQGLRLLKAKYQLGGSRALNSSPDFSREEYGQEDNVTASSVPRLMKSFHFGRNFSFQLPEDDTEYCQNSYPDPVNQNVQNNEVNSDSSAEKPFSAKSFYAGVSTPNSLLRSRSLPVDAIEV